MPDSELVASSRTQLLSFVARGWSKFTGSTTYKLFDALAVEFARLRERIADLSTESNPGAPVEMIDEWESDLGLPDETLPAPSTLEERQALVAAKLLDDYGHSEADLRAIALALGYDYLSFDHYTAFECGASQCGDALTNEFWAHVVGIAYATGDLDAALEAALGRVRRAHADFFFDQLDVLLIDGEPLLLDGEQVLL